MLSDSDSESQGLHTLTINKHYAKAFEYKKEREELSKLKEKYGSDCSGSGLSDANDSEDSEDTEEDTDGEELTPAMDAAILRTLARIKKRDPAIYEGGRRVFEEEHTRTQDKAPARKSKAKEKSKPLTIREAALASALDVHSRPPSPEPRALTHTEEQALLRLETRAVFHGAINSDVQGLGDIDDLLVPRSHTRDEVELGEEEYKAFLEREVGEDLHDLVTVDTNATIDSVEDVEIAVNGDKEGKKKKKRGKKEREKEKETNQEKGEVQGKKATKGRDKESKEEADHEFLMNYIFNRGWIDHSSRRVPTYNEIIYSSSKRTKQKSAKSQADSGSDDGTDQRSKDVHDPTLSDEDSFDDLADVFETSYNFRFEEPGGALITTYSRNIASVRREPTTRKDARARKKDREEAEKQELLQTRREEIRKERALAEVAVAEEGPENENTLVTEEDTSSKKKSKRQQRKEELARLKMLKAKELRRKLEVVGAESGLGCIDDEALAHLDLDADWDPSKHDSRMAELYGGHDGDDDDDAKKPSWEDDINIDDVIPPSDAQSKAEQKKQRKKEKKKNKKGSDDVGVDVDEMDADLDTGAGWDDDGEEWKGTEEERKRKVDVYMDGVVNKLGFSGITSHMPTRFHYTSTAPENYGLTPVEILLSTDAELNSYVGLKKLAPYRIDRGGKMKKNWDPTRTQRLKEFRDGLHSRVGSRYEGAWSLNASTEMQGERKKRKGKKERAKLKARQGEDGLGSKGDEESDIEVVPEVASKTRPEKRKRSADTSLHSDAPLLGRAETDAEDGTRRRRRKRRHHKKGSGKETDPAVEE